MQRYIGRVLCAQMLPTRSAQSQQLHQSVALHRSAHCISCLAQGHLLTERRLRIYKLTLSYMVASSPTHSQSGAAAALKLKSWTNSWARCWTHTCWVPRGKNPNSSCKSRSKMWRPQSREAAILRVRLEKAVWPFNRHRVGNTCLQASGWSADVNSHQVSCTRSSSSWQSARVLTNVGAGFACMYSTHMPLHARNPHLNVFVRASLRGVFPRHQPAHQCHLHGWLHRRSILQNVTD